jgi:hypothetical protein
MVASLHTAGNSNLEGSSGSFSGSSAASRRSADLRYDQSMYSRRPRRSRIVAAIVLLLIASVVLIPTLRRPILRAAGWALVVDDPIGPSDVIVVAVDAADGAGVLEAADLVHAGVAVAVGIFAEPDNRADREFIHRGVPYEDITDRSARQLRSLGVMTIEHIPGTVTGTETEAQILLAWCTDRQYRSVVVVSNSDHSRRLRRVFRRSLRGHGLKVSVRSARYSTFDPDRWWATRGGIRTEIVEFQKLLLDVARHPIS